MYNSENLDSLIESFEKTASAGNEEVEEKEDTENTSVSGELEELLNKEASSNNETGESTDMSKQAEEAGRSMASKILEGLNKEAADTNAKNNEIAAQQAAQQVPTPEGSVDQVLKALVQRAADTGAVDVDGMTDEATQGKDSTNSAPADGAAADNPGDDRTMAKAAAISELVNRGISFDDACELVKQAEQEDAGETYSNDDVEKSAAIGELVNRGFSFDDACDLVKAAEQDMQNDSEEEVTEAEKSAAFNAFVSGGLDYDVALRAVQILSE